MSTLAQRDTVLQLIGEACCAGARLHKACAITGLAARTVQRWMDAGKNALHFGDRRTPDQRLHNCPPNKLSDAERQVALSVLNSQEFKDLPPSQIVPRLADQGLYVRADAIRLYSLARWRIWMRAWTRGDVAAAHGIRACVQALMWWGWVCGLCRWAWPQRWVRTACLHRTQAAPGQA